MNSTNGTYLNGAKLEGEAELSDLDVIRIGDTELRFELQVPGDSSAGVGPPDRRLARVGGRGC